MPCYPTASHLVRKSDSPPVIRNDPVRAGSSRSPALIVNFLYLSFYNTKDADLGTAGGFCSGTDSSLQCHDPMNSLSER